MTTYSVADAKNGLPRLIDRALEGEEVIISRHGKAVAELRPIAPRAKRITAASYAWLRDRRRGRKGAGLTSVELLNQLYDEPEA
ncbi:MAG TPA: type II toxin-antitoxin system prevent-host-death family antitoxin [Caulobacteraceae bacterium]|nr:type II toxin-antitoxin system prevent-host-death family antitoxin [Caulobacteraceae bacterium]